MRTRLSPQNPYGPGRYGFAWEQVPAGSEGHLDCGCYDGAFLASLSAKGVERLVGVDVSAEAVALAHERFPDLDVRHVAAGAALPLPDRSVSSVTLLDVLEHADRQRLLLKELARVLRDDGVLVITVPRRYVFSFLDLGNLKFMFPRFHRRLFLLGHSREQYERRYGSSPDGLVGDVSARKGWHEHFSQASLTFLLARCGLEAVTWDGAGFFARPLAPLLWAMERVPGLRRLAGAVVSLDARQFRSMNLFCVARKRNQVHRRA
jgi:SAM-dependent methyltransferase